MNFDFEIENHKPVSISLFMSMNCIKLLYTEKNSDLQHYTHFVTFIKMPYYVNDS